MKKALSIIATVFLVVACATTGVFADESTVAPTVGLGSYLNFSQVSSGQTFLKVNPDGVAPVVGTYYHVFNNVYIKCTAVTSNRASFVPAISNDGSSFTDYSGLMQNDTTATGYYMRFSFNSNGTLYVSGTYSSNTASTVLLSYVSPSISFGSTIIWNEPSSVNTYSLALPYGNALAISSDSSFVITRRAYSVRNTTYNYQKYVRASDDFSYRVNGAYQGIAPVSSLSGNFGVAVYGSNNVLDLLIPWQPVNQNILGRATEYNFYAGLSSEQVSVSSGNAFLIWYPYYANNQDTSKLNEVPLEISITVSHSSPIYFTTYPITGNTSSSGEDAYISNTASSTDSGSSSQTDDGDGNVTVTFDNAPTAGGNHGQAPINDNNSILGVLSNLQNTLLGLFNKAIDGIHNLITLGSSFLQSVQVMFSWLPAELLVIITSGFVILLTIGVLKTLWR